MTDLKRYPVAKKKNPVNLTRVKCSTKKCDRLVLRWLQSECRECRRKRIHAGLKRIKGIEKERKAKERWDHE